MTNASVTYNIDVMRTYNAKATKEEKGIVKLEGEISADIFESYRPHALKHLGEHATIDGFRKGHIPEDVLTANLSEMAILEEMAEHALREHYPHILSETNVDAIGRPEIAITKIAKANPLGFSIKTAIMPEVKLPDYTTIAKKEGKKPETIEITDKEVDDTIMQIRKSRAEKQNEPQGKPIEPTEDQLPPLDDAFAQSLGEFKTLDELKQKIKENMALEKTNREHEKNRIMIMDKIIEKSEMIIPDMLVNAELDKMLYRMKNDITMMGLSYDDYLKKLNKKEEDIRGEFRADGEKRVKMELVISEIAKKEKLIPEPEAVQKEIDHLMEEYKEADADRVRMYVENILTNELVFKFLENQVV